MSDSLGPLAGVRVVDLTDERAIYGAKLLADLGADVVRVEPPEGDPLRQRGPHAEAAGPGATSLYYAFFASSRRSFQIDLQNNADLEQFWQLIDVADIVLYCRGRYGADKIDPKQLLATNENQVLIDCSSFGSGGAWQDYLAPDLIAGALAGQMATTGDVDTPPLKTFGELNFMVSGAYVAIAALAGLYHGRESGEGQRVEVSVHECIASCIEQVFMFYWYSDTLMRPEGKVLARRGSTHWSDAFTVMNGKGGSIMITPTPDFDLQLAWLIEEDAQGDLLDPMYSDPENIRERIELTMQQLRAWVANKDVEALFFEAQSRHMPYGWVQPIERVGTNPQLQARDWFTEHELGEFDIKSPGAPYRFSETPWQLKDHALAGADNEAILRDIGWGTGDE